MPTYDYRCAACGHEFEEFQSIKADALTVCPSCGKPTLKRIVGGGAGMIFKGTGFYLTDYKSGSSTGSLPSSGGKKGKKAEKSESEGKTDAAASTASSSEKKSDSGSSSSAGEKK